MLDKITPMIITFNEAVNIDRVLAKLVWAKDILIVDSGSSDETLEIVARYPQARVVTRPFDSFAQQCNFGLSHVRTEWVLSMDADYVLSDALVAELGRLQPESGMSGYAMGFAYCINGKRLAGTLYPDRISLYRVGRAHYINAGHAHRLQIEGQTGRLENLALHDDRKPLSRWLDAQRRYVVREVDHLLAAPASALRRTDRLRLKGLPAPILVFFYTLFYKRCLFDGWAGWTYVMQRTYAEVLLALEILERRQEK
jgi:glycosyltransferase involved in cell wall biosynthesis